MSDLAFRRDDENRASGTISLNVDPKTYSRLMAMMHGGTYTVQMRYDMDPNNRRVKTFKAWIKQARDILRWEFRRAMGEPVVYTHTVTAYNVQYTGGIP